MPQSALFKLMGRYPQVDPAQWADFFGAVWERQSDNQLPTRQKVSPTFRFEALSQAVQDDADIPLETVKPDAPSFWYVDTLSTTDVSPGQISAVSLAPDKSSGYATVEIEHFEPIAHWRAELDQLLRFTVFLDSPDIEQCVKLASNYAPVDPVPVQSANLHSKNTMILVDHNPALAPMHWWRLRLVHLIKTTIGEQMADVEPLTCSPVHLNSKARILNRLQSDSRVVILTSLDPRWTSDLDIQAWQSLIAQIQTQGNQVIVIQPKLPAVNTDVLDRIMACACSLVYPESHTLVALAHLFEGGLQDALAAWNHHALEHPAEIFKVANVDYRKYYIKRFREFSHNEAALVNQTIADHRKLKFDCQIAMESLSRAAQGLEPLPGKEWIKQLIHTTGNMTPATRAAYFSGLWQEYEDIKRAYNNHSELHDFFQLVDSVGPSPKKKTTESTSFSFVPQRSSLLITTDSHAWSIFTTSGLLLDENRKLIKEGSLTGRQSIQLTSQDHDVTLSSLQKPPWAERIHKSTTGNLQAAHQSGISFELIPATKENPKSYWQKKGPIWQWASDTGIDDIGLWADLSVDAITYRLRWIPPGSFDMGSPDTEHGRKDNETLHKVTLTQGYWLGETTVPNKFWQAIAGTQTVNEKSNIPATGISWDNCASFLETLSSRIPSFTPRFPTEAEWEYACRAGTKTAYWWGQAWSDEHGNNGNSVKPEHNLPPNTFGLKSMHGNVWEWCEDFYGSYPEVPALDPQGPAEGQNRVLRGGSWIRHPQNLRAAFRDHFSPDDRYRYFGFRLAGGDPQATQQQGASSTADRGEGNELQEGSQARRAVPDSKTIPS